MLKRWRVPAPWWASRGNLRYETMGAVVVEAETADQARELARMRLEGAGMSWVAAGHPRAFEDEGNGT